MRQYEAEEHARNIVERLAEREATVVTAVEIRDVLEAY